MSDEKDNLQEADGIENNQELPTEENKLETQLVTEETAVEAETEVEVEVEAKQEAVTETEKEETEVAVEAKSNEEADAAINEIEESNAEDAEDKSNEERHVIEKKDYHTMSMENLVDEFETLLKHHKIQAIKSHINEIKNEFNQKFNTDLDEKKQAFLDEGGNVIDFRFSSPIKSRFNDAYREYKSKLSSYYNDLEKNLKFNLAKRLEIIEEIKGLLNVEENINTTYKHFKDLQESWRNAGAIPRDKYNNAWNTYHHHVERFYDFLHLNRDLRDLDFKHNLDKKIKIIERAEELAKDDDSNRSFRELQVLHKMWKEELGPVAKEHRDEIWERFSAATKVIHNKRQDYFASLDEVYEKNLDNKHQIIAGIEAVTADNNSSHSAWQKKIKKVEALREEFFNAGKVPIKLNEATWSKFKDAVRTFNRNKNAFYKDLKKDQYDNLKKKLELIKVAQDNKNSDDFETTTALMKKIQSDWKKIGHVPRKDSDKIWKQFKSACNAYFDRFHESKNAVSEEENAALTAKNALLEKVKAITLSGKNEDDLKTIKETISEWKALGRVPRNKGFIEGKFNKLIDGLFGKLDMNKAESDLLRYDNKLASLANADDKRLLDKEIYFIRKKIDETKSEINQLENNLQFFSNVNADNPLVKDVHKNIAKHKESLVGWEAKYRKIKSHYS